MEDGIDSAVRSQPVAPVLPSKGAQRRFGERLSRRIAGREARVRKLGEDEVVAEVSSAWTKAVVGKVVDRSVAGRAT